VKHESSVDVCSGRLMCSEIILHCVVDGLRNLIVILSYCEHDMEFILLLICEVATTDKFVAYLNVVNCTRNAIMLLI